MYMPLTNKDGGILSAIGPNLAGDIKKDNEHFLTVPASIEDLRSSPLTRREFFLRADGELYRLSEPAHDKLEMGMLYQKLTKRIGHLEIEILNFVPHDCAVELMSVVVRNKGKKTVKIEATSFLPLYGRSEKNLRDHRHVSSLLNSVRLDAHSIYLTPTMVFDEKGHRENKTVYYACACDGTGRAPEGQFPTLDMFYGGGDIFHPDAIERGIAPAVRDDASFDGKEACASFRFKQAAVPAGASAEFILMFGISDNAGAAKKIFSSFNTSAKVRKALVYNREYWKEYLSGLVFDFRDPVFNGWLSWVKLQPTLRRLYGCSFLPHFDYGKGGRGWRDLWQDALTLLLTESEQAEDIIVNSFKGVRLDGSNATIITKDGGFIADRNKISRVWMDHGVWPYLTTRLYINRTADIDILLRPVTYFRDHQLKRAKAVDADFRQPDFLQRDSRGKVYEGTILEHLLVQILVQFYNVGDHNVVKLENADWNDGLDMAPDKGESVAFSCMYAHHLKDICVYLERLSKTTESVQVFKELAVLLDSLSSPIDYDSVQAKRSLLDAYFGKSAVISGEKITVSVADLMRDLRKKAAHMSAWLGSREWLPEGFFNGYYDNEGRPVEGRRGGRVAMMLPSQVFAIMSGVASPEQISSCWQSVKKHLFDKKLGGFRLNTDFRRIRMDLGRAYGFAYGDKENGAFFSHMNVMLANALYRQGFAAEGAEVMQSLFSMACAPEAMIPPVLPEYCNGQGRGLYLFLTGSASWYIYTLVEEVLGIKFFLGDLILEPKLLACNFKQSDIKVSFSFQRKDISVLYTKSSARSGPYTISRLFVNEKPVAPQDNRWVIRFADLKKGANVIKAELI